MGRHKWKSYPLPWEMLETAYKGEVCEKCGCVKLHCLNGKIHSNRYLFGGEWHDKTPMCEDTGTSAKKTTVCADSKKGE